jgi:hypothetical protein
MIQNSKGFPRAELTNKKLHQQVSTVKNIPRAKNTEKDIFIAAKEVLKRRQGYLKKAQMKF